jgi:dolichyl-phosphate-mannose-protein mannosyltransferase
MPFGPPDLEPRELVLLGIVLAIGIGLRACAVAHSAVEHFDEGVYASNIYFGAPDYAFPQQRFFGPPLLPALIETAMIVGLPPNLAALLPSFLAGCATIVVLWWFGRSWFGPEVGLSTAALAALSDFHVTFSATALTDVLLGLWLALAVDAMARSLLTGDFRWAVGAGLYTGLAWWTKYNGWLPLAIEAAALPLLWLFVRPLPRQLGNWFGCFAITAIAAVAVWSPFYFSLQSRGGYGPIAENHARYFVGPGGWLHAAATQITNQYTIDRRSSALAVTVALSLPGLLARRNVWQMAWRGGVSIGAGVLVLFWSSILVVGIGALVGLAWAITSLRQAQPRDAAWQRRAIGLAILIAWWGGLLVATPCYKPYARLDLPWLLAAWLGTALNACSYEDVSHLLPAGWTSPRVKTILGLALVVSLFVIPWVLWPHPDHIDLPTDRRGLVHIAKQIHETGDAGQPRAIYVLGEPAIYFQLRAAGEDVVAAVADAPTAPVTIDGQTAPTLLVVGPHAQTSPEFQQQFAAAKNRWELIAEYDYQPSAIVWLDIHDPRQSPQITAASDRVRVYRLRQ